MSVGWYIFQITFSHDNFKYFVCLFVFFFFFMYRRIRVSFMTYLGQTRYLNKRLGTNEDRKLLGWGKGRKYDVENHPCKSIVMVRDDFPVHLSLGKRDGEGWRTTMRFVWRVHANAVAVAAAAVAAGVAAHGGHTATCGVWPPPRRPTNDGVRANYTRSEMHTRERATPPPAAQPQPPPTGIERVRARVPRSYCAPTRLVTLSVRVRCAVLSGEKPGIRRSRGHWECNRRTALALLARSSAVHTAHVPA